MKPTKWLADFLAGLFAPDQPEDVEKPEPYAPQGHSARALKRKGKRAKGLPDTPFPVRKLFPFDFPGQTGDSDDRLSR